MRTLRDVTLAFAALSNSPAGALAVEVLTARNYGVLLAALVEDDLGPICFAASVYADDLHDVILYNGPTALDARLLKGVWEAVGFLQQCNTPGFEDRAYEGLVAALRAYNRDR